MAINVHGDGKKVRVQAAMAVFMVLMGFVFLLDAKTTAYAMASVSVMLLGGIWYYIATHYQLWWHHHHH